MTDLAEVEDAAPDAGESDRLALVRQALEAQGFTRLLHASVDEVAPGRVAMSVGRRPGLLQQNGLFHGGVTAYLVDNATTAAAGTMCRPGQRVLTAEYKLNILAPGLGSRLACVAEVVRPGRSLTVVEARVYDLRDEGRKLSAIALASIAILPAAPGAGPA
ncbi:MAG: PaaI family thioesterase [Sneathiellaceae bacterium]